MKKFLLIVLAMVMLCFATNSYALDFRGLRLGMTSEEVCEWLKIDCKPDYKNDVWLLHPMVQNSLIGNGVNGARVTIKQKVEKIEVSIVQDESEAYRQALHEKYGKPESSRKTQWQNNFGLKLEGISEWWTIGKKKDHLCFSTTPTSVSEYHTVIIFITNELYNSESVKPKPKL